MTTKSVLTTLSHQIPPAIPEGAEAMTVTVELPPGDPGTPPHRHTGPVFGYVLAGEIVFQPPSRRLRPRRTHRRPDVGVVRRSPPVPSADQA